jgi:hypothetical protein
MRQSGRRACRHQVAEPGAVSAADPRAAEAGREMLRAGGSATDAAIATAIALTVVEPQSSGIGGAASWSIMTGAAAPSPASTGARKRRRRRTPAGSWTRPASRSTIRPSAAARPAFPATSACSRSLIPGMASCPGRKLFEPAIRLARGGYRLTERGRDAVAQWRPEALGLTAWARATYLDANGSPKPAGTLIRNPELAGLLEDVARRGADSFYTGPIAERIVRAGKRGAAAPRADDQKRSHHLRRQAARAAMRDLSPPSHLRHGPALVRRHHRVRDPEAARALRPVGARAGQPGGVAPDRGIGAARLCRPRSLSRRSGPCPRADRRADGRALSRRPLRADPARPGAGERRARESAGSGPRRGRPA